MSIQSGDKIKPITITLSTLELAGGKAIADLLLSGSIQGRGYHSYLKTLSDIVKTKAAATNAIPKGWNLKIITGGLYTDDQEHFYSFSFYSPIPEELDDYIPDPS